MTTKQIAEAVNKTERSIQGWAKKTGEKIASISEKIASVGKSGRPADYDIDETCAIIETGLGKNAASLYRQNANARWTRPQESSLTPKDYELIAGIVSAVMANLDKRVTTIEQKVEQRQALLPAPQISPRSHINKLVREYAARKEVPQKDAWRELYTEFGYRMHSNPMLAAKNRGMPVIDYIDSEGQIETLEAVALDFLGGS